MDEVPPNPLVPADVGDPPSPASTAGNPAPSAAPAFGPAAEAQPQCAAHPEAGAIAACGRCGIYVCEGCVGYRDEGGLYCPACAPRVRSAVIPWDREDLGFRRRFIDTTRLLAMEPARAFGQMADGDPGRAVLYAVFGGLLQGLVMGVIVGLLFGLVAVGTALGAGGSEEAMVSAGVAAGMVILTPIFTTIGAVTYVAFVFVPYHLTALALGGQGGASESLRAASYIQVLQVVTLPFVVLQQIPIIGIVIALAVATYALGYVSYALYHHAQGVHRLEGGAAVAAAAAPTVVFVGLLGAMVIALFALILAAVPS